jgi:hypothetical protein
MAAEVEPYGTGLDEDDSDDDDDLLSPPTGLPRLTPPPSLPAVLEQPAPAALAAPAGGEHGEGDGEGSTSAASGQEGAGGGKKAGKRRDSLEVDLKELEVWVPDEFDDLDRLKWVRFERAWLPAYVLEPADILLLSEPPSVGPGERKHGPPWVEACLTRL